MRITCNRPVCASSSGAGDGANASSVRADVGKNSSASGVAELRVNNGGTWRAGPSTSPHPRLKSRGAA
ncbi:MAG: hypothetical protein JNJ54_31920 [Myxococcaceae bacterium]|nr:hypothetical protein [Myxococcaceae bacterium]